jgi:hypothetical protein
MSALDPERTFDRHVLNSGRFWGAVGYSHRMGLGRIGRDHAVERVRRLLPDVRAGRPQTASRKRIVSRSHHGCAA